MLKRWLASLVLVAAATGCSLSGAGRSMAGGVMDAAHDRRDSIAVATGQIMDTVTSRLTRTLRDSLRPEVRNMMAQATDTATLILNRRVTELQDRLAAYMAGTLRDSAGKLVGATIESAREPMLRSIRAWIDEMTRDAQRQLPSVLGTMADTALSHTLFTLDAALKGPLRSTILDLVSAAADTVRLKAELASNNISPGIFQRIKNLGAQILVPLGLAVVAIAAVVYWQFRKRQKILEVIATEISQRGDETLKEAIKTRAQQKNVEKDLHEFLDKRNLV